MFDYKKLTKKYLYATIIIIFSFIINWRYAGYGVFPIDSFLHYDSAYRILNGEFPIRDYWSVAGLSVDFIQAFFFKIFGINWNAYIIHSSLFNSIISILTFYILIKLNLSKTSAFFYSICFAILAYPVSGSPFVDLHATFFCVLAIYFTFLAVQNPNNNLNWFLIVSFFFLAFLSKQVPTTYIVILNTIIIASYLLSEKKFLPLIVIFLSILFYLLIFILSLLILNINFSDFYIQYIDFPQSIGSDRLRTFRLSFDGFVNDFKFILVPLIFIFIIKINKVIKSKIKILSSEFINFLIFFGLCLSLFIHQVLTNNQIYIYFLIPLTFALLQIEVKKLNIKHKNKFIYFIVFLVIFSTVKYHIRYNENRKFNDLSNIDISKHADAGEIHKSLKGISWVTPFYNGSPQDEIEMIKKIKEQIDKKKNDLMLITHYLFLDSITLTSLNSPSKTHTPDGASIPMPNNKHFLYYKNFLYKKLRKENINEVYFIKNDIHLEIITQFFEKDCYKKVEEDLLVIFKLSKKCFN